jgi:hypothetical protein
MQLKLHQEETKCREQAGKLTEKLTTKVALELS